MQFVYFAEFSYFHYKIVIVNDLCPSFSRLKGNNCKRIKTATEKTGKSSLHFRHRTR